MSSTYLFQKRDGEGEEVRALDSTSSITRSAATTETGDPWLCHGPAGKDSYGRRKSGIEAKSSKVVISSVVSEVHPVWEVSSRRRCWATWMARSMGTLVKRETTSKEIRVLSSLRVCEVMNVAKSVELRTL